MSTKAATAAAATRPTTIYFDLTATDLPNGEPVAYFFDEPDRQVVVKPGDRVVFAVNIRPGLPVTPKQVAVYITFTGTNSQVFSADNPIPWPFTEKDPETGYQIVLQADESSREFVVKPDTTRRVVSYSYSVVVKVKAPTAISGPDKDSFFEFRHDPEIYVDEC